MNQSFVLLVVFTAFLIGGGATLGRVLRRLLAREFDWSLVSPTVSGVGLSLVGFVLAVFGLFAANAPYLISIEILVWLGAIGLTGFLPQEYLSSLSSGPVVSTVAGGFLFVIGVYVLVLNTAKSWSETLLIGGLLLLFGILTVALVVVAQFRKTRTP